MEDAPLEVEPYTILGLEKGATQDEVKSAYRKAALKHHPDKASPDRKDAAHELFQQIAFAYAILSDSTRRARYDRTGSTAETVDGDDDFNWVDFFRAQSAEFMTHDAINKFKDTYKGSEEEQEAVLRAYEEGKGSWRRIYNTVMLSNPLTDEDRYRNWLDEAIRDKKVGEYKSYTNESKKAKVARIRKAEKEAEEAEVSARERGIYEKVFGERRKEDADPADETDGMAQPNGESEVTPPGRQKESKRKKDEQGIDDLAAMIQGRRQNGGDFLSRLEQKYGGKKRSAPDEPPEEAFENMAKRTKKGRGSEVGKSGSRAAATTKGKKRG